MIGDFDYTPPWIAGDDESAKPVFHLRAGTIMERDQFEAELEGRYRAGLMPRYQIRDIAIEGVRHLLADRPDDVEAIVDLLNADYNRDEMTPEQMAEMATAKDVLAQHWPAYQQAMAQQARYEAHLPSLAFIRWCSGWERVTDVNDWPIVYARSPLGEIDQDALRRLPPLLVRSAGVMAYKLQYGQADEKN